MKLQRGKLIGVGATMMLALLTLVCSPLAGLDAPSTVALSILVVAAGLWMSEAIPLFVTSLLVLFLSITWLLPVMQESGADATRQTFLSQFFSDITLLFLGGFVLSAALHKLLLDEWLAQSIIRRVGSSPPALMLAVMCITALLSMWLSNTATAAMMLALILPIAMNLPPGDRYRQALILCVPFAANIGGLGTPIGSPPNAIAMQYLREIGQGPSFAMWMLISVPGVILMLLIAWLVLLAMFKGDCKRLPIESQRQAITPSIQLYTVVGAAVLTVAGWMTTSLHGFSTGTVALVPVIVYFSTGVLTVKDFRSLSWDVLILMGGGLCLGTAITESGLAEHLVSLLPVQGFSVFWLMVSFGSVACIMSSLMSNTATANLIMPIVLSIGAESVSPLMIGIAFACTLAMPLPVSTPPNAMAFGTEQVSVSSMVRAGTVITLIGVLLAFTSGYWWWKTVGL